MSGHPCRKRHRNLWYSAGYVASATRQRLYQVGPTVSYALDIFGGTRRQVEEQSTLADCRYQVDAAYLTLTGNSVTQAIQVAATRAQLEAIDGVLDIDRQNVDLVSKERQAGTVPDSDVVAAKSQLAADETLRPRLDQQLSVAKHELSVLLGGAPGDWSPTGFDLASQTLPDQLPVSLPSELVHQRPDILAAEAQLHTASAQIGVATAQLYPSITLSQRQYEQALLGYIRAEAQRYQGTVQLFAAMGGGWSDAKLAAPTQLVRLGETNMIDDRALDKPFENSLSAPVRGSVPRPNATRSPRCSAPWSTGAPLSVSTRFAVGSRRRTRAGRSRRSSFRAPGPLPRRSPPRGVGAPFSIPCL